MVGGGRHLFFWECQFFFLKIYLIFTFSNLLQGASSMWTLALSTWVKEVRKWWQRSRENCSIVFTWKQKRHTMTQIERPKRIQIILTRIDMSVEGIGDYRSWQDAFEGGISNDTPQQPDMISWSLTSLSELPQSRKTGFDLFILLLFFFPESK